MKYSIREIAENIKKLPFFDGDMTFDELMAGHTTMKVGGKAALFVEPANVASAAGVLILCARHDVPVFILGGGSNLIVSDRGFDGIVLSTEKLNKIHFTPVDGSASACNGGALGTGCGVCVSDAGEHEGVPAEQMPVLVTSGCGAKMNAITDFCAKYGICGLESFAGLPGTAGGASYMNARCYDSNISDVLIYAEYIDLNELSHFTGSIPAAQKDMPFVKKYTMRPEEWSYKHSPFQNKKSLVTEVSFRLIAKDKRIFDGYSAADPDIQALIRERNDHFIQDRITKGHFKAPSAGSVFKNNHAFGKPSGVLIDEAGLKGTAVGGAQIAPWHGNFIINTGTATAADIRALVELVQKKVQAKTGFMLEPEIIFCGE